MLKIQNLDHEKSSERISTRLQKRLERTKTQLWNQRSLKSRRWNSHSNFLYSSFFCQLIITPRLHPIHDFSNMHQSDPTLSIRYACKTTAILRRNHRAVSMNSGQTDRHVLGVAKSKILIWPTYYSLLKFKMSEKTITWPPHLHQTNGSTLLSS